MIKPRPIIHSGSISIDRIMNFQGSYKDLIQPDKLHVLSLSILIDQLQDSRGGTAANIAYSLALMGDHPVLLGSIGKTSQVYLDDLAKLGVETSHVHLSDLPTATFTVLTDSDNNQVGGFYPGAMGDCASINLVPWYHQDVLVVISANDPALMLRLVGECQAHRLTYAYDPGQQVSNVPATDLLAGIQATEILFVNDYELSVLTNRTKLSESTLKSQVPIVVTTLGKDGCIIEGKNLPSPIRVGVVPGIKPVDPTGAGDAFRSGFLYGYCRGWDLTACAELGAVVSSYTVELSGTQTHTFTRLGLAERYQKAFNKPVNL